MTTLHPFAPLAVAAVIAIVPGPAASTAVLGSPTGGTEIGARFDEGRPDTLATWAAALPMDPGVAREMARYRGERGSVLGPDFMYALAGHLRADLLAVAVARAGSLANGGCEPFVHVSFGTSAANLPPGLRPTDPPESRFLEALTRVETVACISAPGARAVDALLLYTSPEFRMATESRIQDIREEGDESCVDTGGVTGLLAPSRACNRISRFALGAVATEHSQVISNGEGRRLQPVYFKESVKTFVEVPGGLAYHYVNYTRGAEMGGIGRSLGRRAIRDAEERRIEALRGRLSVP